MKIETVTLISEHHSDPPERIRHSGRAIIIKDNKILLSHELNTNIYMSPGGGLEENESLSECCVREVEEETGLIVKTKSDEFITVEEYCFETLYISHYFPCEVIGTGKSALTPTEIDHGITAEWVEIDKALEIFGRYEEMREDWRSLYLREFTVLNRFLQTNDHRE
jgi:ADP-ribose pyrophosphatase YjhB (NUDIX family)